MKTLAVILAACLAVFVIACDGDDDDSPEPTATTEQTTGGGQQPTQVTGGGNAPTPDDGGGNAPTPSGGDDSPTPPPFAGSTNPVDFAPLPEPPEAAMLVDVRVGAHDGFDRIVFEFEDARPAGTIAYRNELFECGIGTPVDPDGAAMLWAHFLFSVAHTEEGEVSVPSLEVSGPGTSILEAESICDFEGGVEWVIRVPDERPFSVALLEGPSRIVIDVAH